jgi:hypothetical protein
MVQLRSKPIASVGDLRPRVRPLAKDDLPAIGVSRLRASGAITPTMASVTLKVGELERSIGLQHLHFPNGGGWSFFICPQCAHRTRTLRLTEDGRLVCWRCDGLPYRCQQHDRSLTIARLKALLYGQPARLKPRWLTMDRRRRLEPSLRIAVMRQRQARLERMKPS